MELKDRVNAFFDMDQEEFAAMLTEAGFDFEQVEEGKGGIEYSCNEGENVAFTLQAKEQPTVRVSTSTKESFNLQSVELLVQLGSRVPNFREAC